MTEKWFLLQNNHLLLTDAEGHHTLPTDTLLSLLKPHFLRQFKLGVFKDTAYFCAEMNNDTPLPPGIEPFTLRPACDLFDVSIYPVVAKAISILNWDKTHQFCGQCGHATIHKLGTFERVCSVCGLAFYPRISPSIIVRISKGDQLLMARSPHFTAGAYGLIAGFVEPGENIEEAVHREVMEEVSIHIQQLQYVGSQSWPFPDALMFGFTAEYASGEIIVDHTELETAGWFHYNALPGRPSSTISLASKLINEFVAEQAQKSLK